MRVGLSWLGEYLDLGGRALGGHTAADWSVEEIDAAFVRVGLEVEDVSRPGDELTGPLVVGRVREITELTEFKKPIRYCRVDVGPAHNDADGDVAGTRGIVCGATNFTDGDLVVVALPGAVLPGGFTIAARKTYGHVSDGMICSARELGLGDDHSGILVLPNASRSVPGADAVSLLGLDDVVFELAITPDRGYCFSVRGLARELALGLGVAFRDPGAVPTPATTAEPAYPVVVEDVAGCDRFHARVVQGLDPFAATPFWMQRRLKVAGVRSISLAVDVTNYVMLELGQPMHAFDLARLHGPIVVRRGRPGERVTTLDGADRSVDPEDLLITDDTGPIGLAAVMGGATTEVSATTTDLLIECAHWDPVSVTRTARRHKLPSEASKRFERGVDPEMAPVAAERAVQLLTELGGATADERVLDLDKRVPIATIALPSRLPARVVGLDYPPETIERRLRDVGCSIVAADGGTLIVEPPSWRPDLVDPAGLVEEIARLEGYDAIPSLLPATPASPGLTPDLRRRRSIARTLAEAGYTEVLNYPFVAPGVHDAFGLDPSDPRRRALWLANPISDAEPELRTSLLPGLLKAAQRNIGRGFRDLALFELGLVFLPRPDAPPAPRLGVDRRPTDGELEALFAAVPDQPRHVGAVLTGERDPSGWWGKGWPAGWADAIEAARIVAAGVELTVRSADHAPWHPGRCAELFVAEADGDPIVVGYAGELHPRVIAALDLPARTCAMELDLDALPLPANPVAPSISTYPPALLDVALVVDKSVPVSVVHAALAEGAGPMLESLKLFDVYSGQQLSDEEKSVGYSIALRAGDRTLTSEEVMRVQRAAVAAAESGVRARLR